MKSLVICGATATGKTSLAVECALKFGSEVVSADSQLVYRGLNIGTAKPTAEEMRGVRHHMIDVAEPTDNFSVSDYEKSAAPIIDGLIEKEKVPVICGGTGFYINSLLFDYSYGNVAAAPHVREKYDLILKNEGKERLYEILKEIDPVTAQKLHVNDTKRIVRALEIYEVGGIKKSEINDGGRVKREYLAVAVDFSREQLYERINARVDEMFENGLVEEVKSLLSRGVSENNQCMQAIGYKEVVFGLKNSYLQSTMRDIIKQNTRRYAKRQITFFKKMPDLVWLSPEEATSEKIMEIYDGQS